MNEEENRDRKQRERDRGEEETDKNAKRRNRDTRRRRGERVRETRRTKPGAIARSRDPPLAASRERAEKKEGEVQGPCFRSGYRPVLS